MASLRCGRQASPEQPSNFLEAMVSARDDNGRPFSDDVIFGNLMTMLVGGEDTTAYALGWVVHQLCDSPESVMELRQEADELLGTSDVAGETHRFVGNRASPSKLVRRLDVVHQGRGDPWPR